MQPEPPSVEEDVLEDQRLVSTHTAPATATPAAVLIPLIPAALFYAIFLACLTELYSTSFGGGGGEARLAEALLSLWLMGSGGLLWIMLGVQLWVGRRAGGVPARARNAVPPLYLLAAPAAAFAVETMSDNVGGWSGLVPALLPPLIALYGTWAGLERRHGVLKPEIAAGALLVPIALLILATVPLSLLDRREAPRNAARLEAQRDAIRAKKAAELQQAIADDRVRYQNLTAGSPLRDYLRYAGSGDEADMIARMRLVNSRQSDAAALLNDGHILRLSFLWRLDLAATPELCGAYDAALRKMVDGDMPVPSVWYRNVIDHLEEQLPNIKWLAAGGCNLNAGLDAADAPIRFFIEHNNQYEPEQPHWRQLLAATAALRRP
jgi:hypothetical protein